MTRRKDAELQEELRAHLEMATRDRIERGEDPADAAAAARREMGNLATIAEVTREMWGWTSLERLALDVRYGLRSLRRSPIVAAVAVLSLGLGLGANTAIFTVVDALLLAPMPARDPGRLATPSVQFGSRPAYEFCYPAFERFRDRLRDVADFSAVALVERDGARVEGNDRTDGNRPLRVGLVSGNYFELLGVDAAAGRTLAPSDDRRAGDHPVAVLSDSTARRWFGDVTNVVGRTFALHETTYTIVGLTRPGFSGEWIGRPVDVWIPIAMQSQVVVDRPGMLRNPTDPWVRVVARLGPGATTERAMAGVRLVFHQWIDDTFSESSAARFKKAPVALEPLTRGFRPDRAELTPPLILLLSVAGLLVCAACANVGSLQSARAMVRGREMALRLALGASRARLFRQTLTEGLLLSIAGGTIGLVLSTWGTHLLMAVLGSGQATLDLPVGIGVRTVTYAGALSALAGCLFSVPVWRAGCPGASRLTTRSDLPGAAERGIGTRRAFVLVQVATSLVLLVGAGLFVRTWWNLHSQEVGFDRARVLLAWIVPTRVSEKGTSIDLFPPIHDSLSALPGVRSVSVVTSSASHESVLGSPSGNVSLRMIDGRSSPDARVAVYWVGPEIIDALGLGALAGRDFTAVDDERSPLVAIVSESVARRFFGTAPAVGHQVGIDRDGPVVEIAGVVRDAAVGSPRDADRLAMFLPYRQRRGVRPLGDFCIVVRTNAGPASVASALDAALAEIGPRVRVHRIETLEERLDESLARDRLVAALSGLFGLAAAMLMAIGLYGFVAYTTSLRTREFGVRIALGADPGHVKWMVLVENLRVVAAGIGLGLTAALVASRLLAGLLYGVAGADPLTLTVAPAVVIGIAAIAMFEPARRAARVDPAVALRSE